METITSLQNSRIKGVAVLMEKAKARRESGLFAVEGAREIGLARQGGYHLRSLFVCPALWRDRGPLPAADATCEVSPDVFAKLAYREGSDGLLAVAEQRNLSLQDLPLPDNPFIIVLEAVEKPGNLGAILRTADAARVSAVLVCDPQCDLYSPNVVRSSIGTLFTNRVARCTSSEALEYLHGRGVKIFAAELQASTRYHEVDYRGPSAIIVGTEADGLTDFWLKNADARIKIPMRGAIDSLNVSVSTAVITFEAMRQRGFNS
jgi:TrmH family RNA methyltransferase